MSPAATAAGVRITLDANIEFADDLAHARYAGADGVGLYRSEFLLTSHRALPTEEIVRLCVEDYQAFRSQDSDDITLLVARKTA